MTKKLTLKLLVNLLFLLVGVSSVVKAQIPLVGWDCNPIVNGSNLFGPSPFVPTTTAANVSAGFMFRGAGVSTTGTGANRAFGGVGFNVVDAASAIAANKFFTFTINANSGYNLSLSSINPFDYRRSSTGPPNALLQYSINAGPYVDITTIAFPTTASSGASAGPIDLSTVSALQNLPSSSVVYFRIVPYGATGATGTWYIFDVANSTANDFVVNGTVSSSSSLTGASLTFPSTCINSTNIQSTSVSGSGLNGSNVVFGPFSGFGFSTNPAGPFDPSITLTYGGNVLPATTVYVQYAPTTAGSNSGNIPLVGGGVTSTIAVGANALSLPTITANASPNDTVCTGSPVNLLGSGGISYAWNSIPTLTSDTLLSPALAGTYVVTGTDANGCSATSTIQIYLKSSSAFMDDFESGAASPQWVMGIGSYTTTVDNINPGEGNYSYHMNSLSTNSHYQGPTVTMPASTPSSISWWCKTNNTTVNNGYFVVGDNNTNTNNGILFAYFNTTSQLRFFAATGYNHPIVANTWYHVEAKNINWVTKTMDIYIDNVLIIPNWPFRTTASTEITKLYLHSLGSAISDYDKIVIGSEPFPMSVSTSSNPICSGASTNITASGGASSYQWMPGNIINPTINVSPTSNTTYTVTGTDNYGCTLSKTSTINVNALPSVVVTTTPSPATVCTGGTVTLDASGTATSYSWTDGINTPSNGVAFTPSSSSTYTVTGTDGNGCTATSTIAVTVNPLPNIGVTSLPSPASVCSGSSVTLNGTGATSYTWTDGVNTPTDGVAFISTSNSTFTVTGTDGNGCTGTNTIAVTVNSLPTVGASSLPTPATVCQGSNVTLNGAGALSYTWTDGTNTPADGVAFAPASSSTYTVTGTDGNGCTGTSTLAVTVNIVPAPTAVTATPSTICAGASSDLNATSVGNSINWYTVPTAGVALGTSASGANFNVTPSGTTIYYAEASTPAGGTQTFNYTGSAQTFIVPAGVTSMDMECWGAQGGANWINNTNLGGYSKGTIAVTPGETLTIYVGNQPTTLAGGFNGGGAGDGAGRAGGGASDVRQGGTALSNRIIVAGGGGGAGYWSSLHVVGGVGGGANLSGGDGYREPSFSNNPGGKGATVLAAGPDGTCASFNNTNMAGAFGQGGSPASFGCGCEGYGGGGGWYGGAGSGNCRGGGGGSGYVIPSATNLVASSGVRVGDGQVTFTWSGSGCASAIRTPVTLTVNPTPSVTASATPSTTCNNSTVTPMGGGASTYAWSGGLTDNTPFVATTGTTTYTVTGTDGIGCTATSTVSVTVNAASGMLASATSNQAQNQADDFSLSYYDPSCNLIASIDDIIGGNVLGLTTASVNVDANAGVHNGQPFVRRWYQITPSNNVGVSASVTLYIDQADFTNYNNTVASPYLPMPTSGNNSDPNITNIRITKNSDAGLGNNPEVIIPNVFWNGNFWELNFTVAGFSQFRVHSANPGNTPLPATITKFNGRKLNSSDMLEWTTASEQNNAYFNLQHSTNGVDFKTIAKVNSKAQNGNSQTELNYGYEHTTPSLGHNYYRLEQVDIDNQSTINAKIVDIIWGANGSTVSMYPNPTQDVLNIDLYTSKVQNTTVKVLDMSGRVVKQIQARSEAGMSTLSISLGELASGVYTVQVYDNDKLSHVGKVKKND